MPKWAGQAVWILRADFGLLNFAQLCRKLHVLYIETVVMLDRCDYLVDFYVGNLIILELVFSVYYMVCGVYGGVHVSTMCSLSA